jgi:hypothetical protein
MSVLAEGRIAACPGVSEAGSALPGGTWRLRQAA